jgi:hypothetical protein
MEESIRHCETLYSLRSRLRCTLDGSLLSLSRHKSFHSSGRMAQANGMDHFDGGFLAMLGQVFVLAWEVRLK